MSLLISGINLRRSNRKGDDNMDLLFIPAIILAACLLLFVGFFIWLGLS